MAFTPIYGQFEESIPADGSTLYNAQLSALADAVFNTSLPAAIALLTTPIATTTTPGKVIIPTGALTVDTYGNLTPVFGSIAGTVMQGNDARVLGAVQATTLAAFNYLTASTAVTSVNSAQGVVSLRTTSLLDVSNTAPVTGQVLTWTGTTYQPRTPSATATTATFQGLSDVAVPNYINGQILQVLNNQVIAVTPNYLSNTGGTLTGAVAVPNTTYPNVTSPNAVNAVYVAASQAAASTLNASTYAPINSPSFTGTANFTGAIASALPIIDMTKVRLTATGTAYSIPANTDWLAMVQSATIASQTITLPVSPVDGQVIRISTINSITALTLTPAVAGWTNGNQLAASTSILFGYDTILVEWMKL